jgi:hypothetical protein
LNLFYLVIKEKEKENNSKNKNLNNKENQIILLEEGKKLNILKKNKIRRRRIQY